MLRNNWTFPYTAEELVGAAGRVLAEQEAKMAAVHAEMLTATSLGEAEQRAISARRAKESYQVQRYARYKRLFEHASASRQFALRFQELPTFGL